MSKKSNPTLIGAFVVGAVVLLAVGVALFGGGELLAKRQNYVAYFVESTQGLRAGSNIVLNGVRVGFVSGTVLIVDQQTYETMTEVTMEILPESYIVSRDGVRVGRGLSNMGSFERVVNEGGLRATLQVESFITGQLLVELVSRPNDPPVFRGGAGALHPEIPTVPSEIAETLARVQTLIANVSEGFDAKELGQRIQSILRGVDELANSQDLLESLAGINRLTNRKETQELTIALNETLDEFRGAASDARVLLRNIDGKLDSLETDIRPVIENLVGTLDEAQATMAAVNAQLQGESAGAYQLGETLKEIEAAARALREFLDYLERNPEAILRGK